MDHSVSFPPPSVCGHHDRTSARSPKPSFSTVLQTLAENEEETAELRASLVAAERLVAQQKEELETASKFTESAVGNVTQLKEQWHSAEKDARAAGQQVNPDFPSMMWGLTGDPRFMNHSALGQGYVTKASSPSRRWNREL